MTSSEQVPQKNLPHQMTAACDKQGSAGDGTCRPDKQGGEKEEIVLNWACPEERSEQRLCCCPWIEARGEEGERQARIEHIGNSKTGSKQPPAVEGVYTGLVRLLARRDLTTPCYLWKLMSSFNGK